MNKDFEAILKRYDMPQGIDWESVRRKIQFELSLIQKPSDEETAADEGREYDATKMDSEALIRTIKLFEAGGAIEIKGEGDSVQIEDETLKRFVLLSLHKLLQMKWTLYKPNEEELQKGKFMRYALGSPDYVEIGFKKEIGGGFIEPYNSEELEALLKLELGLKNYKKIRQGRGGKNVACYGDCVAAVLGAIPEEVKTSKGKTDLLNFVGEVMEIEGILKNVPKWGKLSKELERAEASSFYVTGGIRQERQKMLDNWLKGARQTYCKSELAFCKDCKDFGKCIVSAKLKNYEL